ncbi:flagellar motor switch protein FliG [Neogemmobacter tilapiae]|uniref:Flagellar motor switch protein FliG n=1 Tax=Neogemmobacter tilapiae TaxID=875041 RepID=A0A918TFR7_9RHOB|nr:FliG C-terminal domain-containing protein [Gemmobacter tilapiae]GHC46560.1 flagellar motor switch protein FliG [Gemmobacter tilapiae]
MAQALAQITPATRAVRVAGPSPREKAAIIVRVLLAQGAALPLSGLPEHLQAALAEQIGHMRLVDRATLDTVVDEFMAELDAVGIAFPGGIEGALAMMDGHISATAASRLRRLAGASLKADPWDHLTNLPPERLIEVLEQESVEVGAVMLSKLPVGKAADLLGRLPGEKARRVAYAVSQTGNVDPETVRKIGIALHQQMEHQPPKAFDSGPVERVGAILNISPPETREQVLRGLDETDRDFAEKVRRAIFTFVHIPARLSRSDVPKVLRGLSQPQLVTALVAASANPDLAAAAEYLLGNMSQRMAQTLREEMVARGRVKTREGDEAMSAIISAIRDLELAGELVLIVEDDE